MIIFEEIKTELLQISQDWTNGALTFEKRNSKLDLLQLQIETIYIDYNQLELSKTNRFSQEVMNQLLKRCKVKAKVGLEILKRLESKQHYNVNAHFLAERTLFFHSILATLERNIAAYNDRNKTVSSRGQVFKFKKEKDECIWQPANV